MYCFQTRLLWFSIPAALQINANPPQPSWWDTCYSASFLFQAFGFILNESTHPEHLLFNSLPSGRLEAMRTRTDRLKTQFPPHGSTKIPAGTMNTTCAIMCVNCSNCSSCIVFLKLHKAFYLQRATKHCDRHVQKCWSYFHLLYFILILYIWQ